MVTSRSRELVDELMVKLAAVREVEKSEPVTVPHDYGNLAFNQHHQPLRMTWIHTGGVALEKTAAPNIESEEKLTDGTPAVVTPALGYRRSIYRVRIWARDVEEAELLLDQLVTASKQTSFPEWYVFDGQSYKISTEVDGRWLEHGKAALDANVIVRTTVAARPIGSTQEVIVAGSEFRAGIENPAEEDLEDSEYDVDRLTTAWPG